MSRNVKRKKNRSYTLCADTVSYVVSHLDTPAPAAAAWICRRRLTDGVPVPVVRKKWFAARWTTSEFRRIRPMLEELGLPIPDDLEDATTGLFVR